MAEGEVVQHVEMDEDPFTVDYRVKHSIQYADGVYLRIERDVIAGEIAIMFQSTDGAEICGLMHDPEVHEVTLNLRVLPAS
jgi:hypothetical protein